MKKNLDNPDLFHKLKQDRINPILGGGYEKHYKNAA